MNAMASVRVNAHVEVQANLTNLSNARYVDCGSSGHFVPGAGRAVVVGPSVKFNLVQRWADL